MKSCTWNKYLKLQKNMVSFGVSSGKLWGLLEDNRDSPQQDPNGK